MSGTMAMVKFLCPNGHALNAPANLVGKAGKCPKCGTAFIVPSPDGDSVHESAGDASASAEVTAGSSPSQVHKSGAIVTDSQKRESGKMPVVPSPHAPKPASSPKNPPVETFFFLCPNGHKLSGPVTLKGKLGQCPHCSSKFKVPDDTAEDDEPEYHPVDESLYEDLPEDDSAIEFPESDNGEPDDESALDQEDDLGLPEAPDDSAESRIEYAPDLPAGPEDKEYAHPLAEVLANIWRAKGESGEVELTLEDGSKLQPDLFSPQLSRREFAVFATHDGITYSVLSLPWKSIRRVAMNKVDELPNGLFLEK